MSSREILAHNRRRQQLEKDIADDPTISEESKQDFLARASVRFDPTSFHRQAESGKQLIDLRDEFVAAKRGKAPKFKGRQFLQAQRTLLADRPGQKQTLLTGGRGPAGAVARTLISGG